MRNTRHRKRVTCTPSNGGLNIQRMQHGAVLLNMERLRKNRRETALLFGAGKPRGRVLAYQATHNCSSMRLPLRQTQVAPTTRERWQGNTGRGATASANQSDTPRYRGRDGRADLKIPQGPSSPPPGEHSAPRNYPNKPPGGVGSENEQLFIFLAVGASPRFSISEKKSKGGPRRECHSESNSSAGGERIVGQWQPILLRARESSKERVECVRVVIGKSFGVWHLNIRSGDCPYITRILSPCWQNR